ncbi:MAG: hypothetical protein K2X41_10410 [Hyphomicrobium sp.]|nr:hypothetical protein [Hyphomicrobium sp.]
MRGVSDAASFITPAHVNEGPACDARGAATIAVKLRLMLATNAEIDADRLNATYILITQWKLKVALDDDQAQLSGLWKRQRLW